MPDARKVVVAAGYDAMAERYLDWSERIVGDPRQPFLAELSKRLADGSRVLDLGCGAGVPSTREMAQRFEVTGVDISEEQVRRARENVPGATFICSDLADLDFGRETFDAVTAFYSISHLPRDEHGALFEKIASWLKPGGFFLASLGASDSADWSGDWLGVPMFFSSHDAGTNRRLVSEAGLAIVLDKTVTMHEPEGEQAFLWVLAVRQPTGS